MIKDYFKKEWKSMVKALIVSLIVGLIFFAYIQLIGKPLTEGRNTYNEEIRLESQELVNK